MRKSILIDTNTDDIYISETGKLYFTRDNQEYVSQKIKNKVSVFLGEWWLDVTEGLPYRETILIKNPDLNLVTSTFVRAIGSVEEVEEILSFSASFDTSLREYKIEFRVKTTEQEIIEGII